MKKSKLLALLLALTMLLSLAACGGGNDDKQPDDSTPGQSDNKDGDDKDPGEDKPEKVEDSEFFGPIYDEWSDMTDDELYQKALEEVKEYPEINIYATSSKMMKAEDDFEAAYPGLDVVIMDMDQDEVLEKCVLDFFLPIFFL